MAKVDHTNLTRDTKVKTSRDNISKLHLCLNIIRERDPSKSEMEIALSAALGEVAHRSISFLMNKFSKEAAALPHDENLRRVLMRVHIIVEEAEGRHISNQAMLQQLKVLCTTMYRGYYVLDTFRYRAYSGDDDRHGHVSRSFSLSKFNPAKRIQLCAGTNSSQGEEELCQMLGSLEITITNASEFIMLLNGCPPLGRQIYSTYLVMERCMFARHAEMECIINFLTQKGSQGTQDLGVLPIFGPMKAGKSTLIEHACNDGRVCMTFSQIVLLTEADLHERLTSSPITDRGTVKHRSCHAMDNQRILLIVELNGDVDEATWSNLYSACKRYAANDSKVIICSRSDGIARFGTTRPLKVEYLTKEAYWYFFKALAFGSANPEEEPRLASAAMETAECMDSSFIAGNMIARMLRANLNLEFWRKAMSWMKATRQRDGLIFGGHPVSPWQNKKPSYVPRLSNPDEYCWIFNDYQIVSAEDQVQEITLQEVFLKDVVPHGKFDALAWRSSIPPHSCCIFRCGVYNKVPKMSAQPRRRRWKHDPSS